MTNDALDNLRLQECAKAWSELNYEDPQTDSAIESCEKAMKLLAEVETLLFDAAEDVDGSNASFHLRDFMREAEGLECSIRLQVKELRGWS